MRIDNDYFNFKELPWDTENFNVDTYELFLKQEIPNYFKHNLDFLKDIKGLIYIRNMTCNRQNSKYIGTYTKAVLYDTNIKFELDNIETTKPTSDDFSFRIVDKIDLDEELIQFSYSRFYNDLELKKHMKKNIYREWVINSFNNENKHFLILESNNLMLGYILFNVINSICTIELISIRTEFQNMKIGTKLVSLLKYYTLKSNVSKIVVGTQINNIKAINFYIKNGFYVSNTTDIYHWWV